MDLEGFIGASLPQSVLLKVLEENLGSSFSCYYVLPLSSLKHLHQNQVKCLKVRFFSENS